MRKRLVIKEFPTILEFYSYNLNFLGLLAGPCTFFHEWKVFIETNKGETSKARYLTTFFTAVLLISSNVGFGIFGIKHQNMFDEEWINSTSFVYKLIYCKIFAAFVLRAQFYFAWMLSESINVAGGFGFNEKTKKWDLLANVDLVACESATNAQKEINNWNIRTTQWLRHVCYERSPKSLSTALTFALSALWHGFYPGYYYRKTQKRSVF